MEERTELGSKYSFTRFQAILKNNQGSVKKMITSTATAQQPVGQLNTVK